MRKLSVLSLSVLLLSGVAVAQETKKPLSPPAKAEATLNGKKITIDYSAPSKRGRDIMGVLVPFDKVWRTGANAATTLTTEGDLMIGKIHVPAGKYTLFTIPGEKEWTLIVNKQTGQWGTKYDQAQDLGRTKMTVKTLPSSVETFAIDLKPMDNARAPLTLKWDNTEASVMVFAH
ncbi:MAG TPA: DUF2911 domain-containing protein [Thermoanaerobaculia bacterium]|nr:DUF2911 domain-containing protein [Thermoanaerobaculia bacterium]